MTKSELISNQLPAETSYAIHFARKTIGDKLVSLMRAVGNKNFVHTGHKSPEGKDLDALDNWGNVARHCLLESIICDVIAEKLGLNSEIRSALIKASFLHDLYKKEEMVLRSRTLVPEEKMKRTDVYANFEQSSVNSALRAVGLNTEERSEIIEIIEGIGARSYGQTHLLLEKGWASLTDLRKAKVILHVIDDLTINDKVGNFLARIEKNRKNPAYAFEAEVSRKRMRDIDFAGADLSAYSKDKLGERGLSNEELAAFNAPEISPLSPNISRMQEIVGLRARNILAETMGIKEEDLNEFIIQELVKRQQEFVK